MFGCYWGREAVAKIIDSKAPSTSCQNTEVLLDNTLPNNRETEGDWLLANCRRLQHSARTPVSLPKPGARVQISPEIVPSASSSSILQCSSAFPSPVSSGALGTPGCWALDSLPGRYGVGGVERLETEGPLMLGKC